MNRKNSCSSGSEGLPPLIQNQKKVNFPKKKKKNTNFWGKRWVDLSRDELYKKVSSPP